MDQASLLTCQVAKDEFELLLLFKNVLLLLLGVAEYVCVCQGK